MKYITTQDDYKDQGTGQPVVGGFPGAYFCIKAFSETDLTEV